MKLYLDKNVAKGTPEELARYKEITSNSNNHLERRLEDVTNGLKPESLNTEVVDDEVGNPDYKKGCFYTITEEARESLLPVGVVLKHQSDRMFNDSLGVKYLITNQDYLKRDNIFDFQDEIIKGRFDFAEQLGIRLNTTTDFSVEASDKTFKIKEDDVVFAKGELVKLVRDDNDRLPLFESIKDNRNDWILINKVEPTQDTDTEEESPYKELKVGDRVKVLKSEAGAVGEAVVTNILEGGYVSLSGKNKYGKYLTDWRNYVYNVEKIEDDIKGYTFWYIDGITFKNHVVLKTTLEGHFEDSEGRRYTYQSVQSLIKPIDRKNVREEFEEAKHSGRLLKYYSVQDLFVKE